MRLIPVLSPTRNLKVVVCFGENRFAPFSCICSVMKISHYKYFGRYLVVAKIRFVGYQ